MALSFAEIYRLTTELLMEVCLKQGLDSVGPVRVLRQRLVRHLKAEIMANKQEDLNVKASVTTDLLADIILTRPHYALLALMWVPVISGFCSIVLWQRVPSLF